MVKIYVVYTFSLQKYCFFFIYANKNTFYANLINPAY